MVVDLLGRGEMGMMTPKHLLPSSESRVLFQKDKDTRTVLCVIYSHFWSCWPHLACVVC